MFVVIKGHIQNEVESLQELGQQLVQGLEESIP